MQVVTSENIVQLHQTGKVDEFKAPVAAEAKAADPVEAKGDEPARDTETGKFVPKGAKDDKTEVKADKDAATAVVDDDEDADLPERVRKQIGKKHRAMKEAEEKERDATLRSLAAVQRAEALERELQTLKSGPAKGKDSDEPKPEDFKTVGEYTDALVDYKFAKKEAEQQQKAVEAAQNKRQAEFIERLNAVRKEIKDFDEVTGESDLDVVPHVASYIAESDMGPKLGYHFAKNPDELERIQKLSPIRAIAELGKLEIKLEKPAEPEKAPDKAAASISKAPSPITTIASEGKTVVTKDPAKMSLQELREYDRQQREAKRR